MVRSPAERARAYRARKRERGEKPSSGKSTFKNTKWDNGNFIALDGEGESIGEIQKFEVGSTGKTYESKDHIYTLLAASSGEYVYSAGKRLLSIDCINYLLDLAANHKRGIFVIFAGGYDVNHMLLYGFGKEALLRISRGETKDSRTIKTNMKAELGPYAFEHADIKYEIEYRARKSLTLRRGFSFKTDKNNKFKPVWESRIVIWDVFGFFQESFVGVMKKWLGEKWHHYELIKRMKLLRGDFANVDQSDINAYNAAELETLVAIMDKVRDAITGLDLKLNRWDGAGSVASALMRKHNIRNFKKETDKNVVNAVRTAYAGGRIEVCKIGFHKGNVYDYDINSAYPSVMADLPCMLHGHWIHGTGNPPIGFTLVHLNFDLPDDHRFYPFFYRTDKMQISFPSSGEGIYWYPEYEAGISAYGGYVSVIEWWQWIPSCNHKPFHWIPDYYYTRQQWIKNPTEDWHYGAEKIIKLGLNSLYGKTAQQLGGKMQKAPAYHQLEWAGYITSSTRARLFRAAILQPESIIGFATDGIFSTEPLPLEISTKKDIGAWELKEPLPCGMTIAMAGVYWWHYDDNSYGHFSRGFDKDSMKTPDLILQAWKEGKNEIDIPMHRLIGMGSACSSDTLWEMRGRFTQGMRTLKLDGASHKRQIINIVRTKPHLHLVDLKPALNIEYGYGAQGCSHPYPIQWLDTPEGDDYQNDLELQREMFDTENV